MKTNKLTQELQEIYRAMVDSVEEFVMEEGKTLKEAFHEAEKKLEDANETSKEKIKHASNYLKYNFRLWGDAIEGVSETYKEELLFDIDYVNNSIWRKIQSIASSNSAELNEFTRNLQEEAQTVISHDHLDAHKDHNQWASEHALWLDEIEFWKQDHEQALTKLVEIKKALKEESTSLFEHAQVIKSHAEIDHEHEKTMSNAEQDPSSKNFKTADDKEIAMHKNERQVHTQHAQLHQTLKTHHFKTMAMINMLYKQTYKA